VITSQNREGIQFSNRKCARKSRHSTTSEAVVHLASGGSDYSSLRLCSVQEVAASARRIPKGRTRAAWPCRRTRLSHDIYFAERLSCAKPLESPCRRCGARFAGTCPRSAFCSFWNSIVLGHAYATAVTINIFIARSMPNSRYPTWSLCGSENTNYITNVCCHMDVNQKYCVYTT